MTITDGEPTGERENKVREVIKDAKKACKKSVYGDGAVAFEFAQVGARMSMRISNIMIVLRSMSCATPCCARCSSHQYSRA